MRRTRTIVALAFWAGLGALLFSGCPRETREKILPIFFDGVPGGNERSAPPPTRRVRRDLFREIDELKRALAEAKEAANKKGTAAPSAEEARPPAEQAKTWEEAVEKLPKDAAGGVDWVQALKTGVVAPRPSADLKAPTQAVLDLDLELASSGSRALRARFSHAAHTAWLGCGSCHPAIFPLKGGAAPTVITMAKIQAGQYCGACHGRVAFGVEHRCARCHRAVPAKADWSPSIPPAKPIERATTWSEALKLLPGAAGAPDWAKALADGVIAPRPGIDPKAEDEPVFPLDVELVPADNPAFKAVFPHAAHTAVVSCATCHPGIFQMKAGADPITMAKIFAGEYCGRCHGTVAFPAPTGCPRCHPVLAGK